MENQGMTETFHAYQGTHKQGYPTLAFLLIKRRAFFTPGAAQQYLQRIESDPARRMVRKCTEPECTYCLRWRAARALGRDLRREGIEGITKRKAKEILGLTA